MLMCTKSKKTSYVRRPPIWFLGKTTMIGLMMLFFFGLISTSTAQSSVTNAIHSIEIEGENDSKLIRILTSTEPTFTVFRLSDPMRVVVDISGGDFKEFQSPASTEGGSLEQIATRQFHSNGFVVGRIIIGFDKELNYTVNSEGNSVIVRTNASGLGTPNKATPPLVAPIDRTAIERLERAKKEAASQQEELEQEKKLAIEAASNAKVLEQKAMRRARQIEEKEKVAKQAHQERLAQIKSQKEHAEKEHQKALQAQKAASAEKQKAQLAVAEAQKAKIDIAKREKTLSKKLVALSNQDAQLQAQRAEVLDKEKLVAKKLHAIKQEKKNLASPQQALSIAGTKLLGLKRSGSGAKAKVLLELNNATSYHVERIENPPRLVIDLMDTIRKTPKLSYRIKSPHVRRIRLGDHHNNKVRAVFDLEGPDIAHQVEETEDGVLVSLRTLPKTNSVAKLKDVVFEGNKKVARIILDVNPQELPKVDTRSNKAWVLTLDKTQMKKALERSLDTSAYKSIVRMISTYRDESSKDRVKVVANLSGKASQTIKRVDGKLVWEIQKIAPRVSASTTAPRTAGFATQSATLARTTPKQTRAPKKRISIDLKDASVINVLRLLSEVSGENIIASDKVGGNISLSLRNVPWDDVLDTLLKTKGYGKVRQKNIIRIAPTSVLRKEREDELARRKARIAVEETAIKIITVNYAIAKDIVTQLQPMLSERGTVQTDERTNTIIVEEIVSNIDRLVQLTRHLDRQTPQVLIEARIVEAASNHLRSLGIQWGGTGQMSSAEGNATGLMFPGDVVVNGAASTDSTPSSGTYSPSRYAVNLPAAIGGTQGTGLGFIFGSAGGSQLLALRLTAMEENGNGRVISSPRITTLDNRKAMISQGVRIPVSVVSANGANTQWVQANLQLEVTPHVTNDGSILMAIKTQKSEPDFTQTGAAGDPTIKEKSAETEVLVKDGDTTVIGGIYTRTVNERRAGVPVLSKIPILGWLFRKTESRDDRSELLIFITPRIVNRDESLVQNSHMKIEKEQ